MSSYLLSIYLYLSIYLLVLHPEKWLRKILGFLDLPWTDQVLHHEQQINKKGKQIFFFFLNLCLWFNIFIPMFCFISLFSQIFRCQPRQWHLTPSLALLVLCSTNIYTFVLIAIFRVFRICVNTVVVSIVFTIASHFILFYEVLFGKKKWFLNI